MNFFNYKKQVIYDIFELFDKMTKLDLLEYIKSNSRKSKVSLSGNALLPVDMLDKKP